MSRRRRGGRRLSRAKNKAHSPFRDQIDGKAQCRISDAIEDAGHDLGAIYHSQTRSAPEPSQTDINLAFDPDALYLILGLAGRPGRRPRLADRDGPVAEAELEVT